MSDYATVDVSPSGGDDPNTDGVEITVGDQPTTVTVTVTAEDGSTTDYYGYHHPGERVGGEKALSCWRPGTWSTGRNSDSIRP